VTEERGEKGQDGNPGDGGGDRPADDQTHEATDPSGKPTIDEPTGPALDLTPDEFDKQAEEQVEKEQR
jgi:hypothetical protein